VSSADLEVHFPNLRGTEYRVTSPKDKSYNCVAWAAGVEDKYWDPSYHWPIRIRHNTVDGWVSLFRSLGYEVCEDTSLERGFEKVVIYSNGEWPTHVARQRQTGSWTSKCGDDEDIEHALEGLEGSDYGRVRVAMKRSVASGVDHEQCDSTKRSQAP